MKKEEAVELLKGRKVYVNGKSKEIQEKLFELGFLWSARDGEVGCVYKPFLYTNAEMCITHGNDMEWFKSHKYKEISADEILSIKLEEEFKDGDIVVSGWSFGGEDYSWIAIIKKLCNPNNYKYYALLGLRGDEEFCTSVEYNDKAYSQEYTRIATDEEKKVLFDALKKDGKRWDAEKKCIEEVEYEFKPFERVLVRDDNSEWQADLFSHKLTDKIHSFQCVFNRWVHCIPYEGNEDLLGTNKPCKK